MKRVLLLDTETTGLPGSGAQTIEVACMVYDLEHASALSSFASLIRANSNAAKHINCISDVWPIVRRMVDSVDAICAHRAEFDQQFVPADIRDAKPWICTKVDVDWPDVNRGEHLVHLALAYDVGVVTAHRAMTDVDIMARIFTRIAEKGHSLDELLTRAMRPKARVIALVSYKQKDLAKQHGFLWDDAKKEWYRNMPVEDTEELPFNTRVVGAHGCGA
jgi:DNA polymerase-3 subunit epsilon